MSKWLALDVATTTGFSHEAESGIWCFEERTRLVRFYERLEQFRQRFTVSRVVFESAVAYARHGGFEVEIEMHGVLKLWCAQRSVKYIGVNPTTLKKWATGNGRASKEQMIAAARKMFPGATVVDDNLADALMLRLYAKRELT